MYHNFGSLCSLGEGKKGAKTNYTLIVLINCRNLNQHVADYLFGSNSKFSVGFGRLRPWDSDTIRLRLQ